MHIANTDVAYLAFEGGGGKGVTYVGALKALEELGVLPIDIEKPGQNQIKGISGGSAGAIVALLVAMGIRSTDLIKILANPATFERFFDGPLIGQSRMVNRHNQPAQKVNPSPTLNPEIAFLPPVLTLLIKVGAVSYTHLDVYKRQTLDHISRSVARKFTDREDFSGPNGPHGGQPSPR